MRQRRIDAVDADGPGVIFDAVGDGVEGDRAVEKLHEG